MRSRQVQQYVRLCGLTQLATPVQQGSSACCSVNNARSYHSTDHDRVVEDGTVGEWQGWFQHLKVPRRDTICEARLRCRADPNPDKIDLSLVTFRDDDNNAIVLESVREAKRQAQLADGAHEIQSLAGHPGFVQRAIELAYGADAACIREGRVAAVQTVSGTAACRLFAQFQFRHYRYRQIHMPRPTWFNHLKIWEHLRIQRSDYRYYGGRTRDVNWAGFTQDLERMSAGEIVLLQPCAHNPTGCDLDLAQWQEAAEIMLEGRLFPFFDCAYQGLASGDLDNDAQGIRAFEQSGHEMAVAQSFAANTTLWGERPGCLSFVCSTAKEAEAVQTSLEVMARSLWSSPPAYGARIVHTLLSDPDLRQQWEAEVKGMTETLQQRRQALVQGLMDASEETWQSWALHGSPHQMQDSEDDAPSRLDCEAALNQRGMFSMIGLNPKQVAILHKEHSIYPTRNGRIALGGITPSNLQKAPHSLLSKMLLAEDPAVGDNNTLVIPSKDTAPDVAVWKEGSEELFKACMDCYNNERNPPRVSATIPIDQLRRALDFFIIPSALWPPVLCLTLRAQQRTEYRRKVAGYHLSHCFKIMDGNKCRPNAKLGNFILNSGDRAADTG
ncbi:hypothetical protein WJX73_004305 [Symbiochloris irregularis]|uniref:Aminotransferase class I/classII large domain-containing protein n=1 Tax=Symbiochloris irregularis TaxID=706552 RepID=A0AAW1PVS6_9CHLO